MHVLEQHYAICQRELDARIVPCGALFRFLEVLGWVEREAGISKDSKKDLP